MPATANSPNKEKSYELRQRRAGMLDNNRVLIEKAEKENRALTSDEQEAFDHTEKECRELEKRISTIDRQIAIDSFGDDPGPEKRGRNGLLPHEDPNNTKNGQHRFSMMAAIKCLAERRALTGLEAEVSAELSLRTGKSPQGFLMPLGASQQQEQRALDTTTGAGAISTVTSADWIELLRNNMVLSAAGVRQITDLQGKFSLPRQNTSAQGFWVAESTAPSGSAATFDQVQFQPKTVGAWTDVSRRFFELSVVDSAESFTKDDIAQTLSRTIDASGFTGTGGNIPLGLMNNTGISATRTIALGTNGGAPTWASMVGLTTIVSRGNASALGEGVFVTNADGVGTLSTTPKTSTWPMFLMEDGKVYAKRVLQTQAIPNNLVKGTSGATLSAIIYGVFSQMVLAYWSGLDLLVDPFTGGTAGTVRVIGLIDMDLQIRHNEAFSLILDMASNQV